MAEWKLTIDVQAIWTKARDRKITCEYFCKKLHGSLLAHDNRILRLYGKDVLEEYHLKLKELKESDFDDFDDFDYWWSDFYDFCDHYKVWVKTII